MPTKIQWCDETWNPTIGCTKLSPGCKNCYALPMARRLAGIGAAPNEYKSTIHAKGWSGNILLVKDALEKPYRWRKHRKVFVGSMGDLFHENQMYTNWLKVLRIMQSCPRHTYMLLTKRPANMISLLKHSKYDCRSYIWHGVTAENQEQADLRIPYLDPTLSPVRFVSIEPILGPVDISRYLECGLINWVIVGGETGNKARPLNLKWFNELYHQCKGHNVPLFVKGPGSRKYEFPSYLPSGFFNDNMYKQFPNV